MSIRFGSVRNLAVHEIFSDDHDVRKDIDLIDGKTFIDDIQKDVRDVVKIMYPSRIRNFHVVESGLRKINELTHQNLIMKKYLMGEKLDGKPKVSGNYYRHIVECIEAHINREDICSLGFQIIRSLISVKDEVRRILYRDALINCNCSRIILDAIKLHIGCNSDVCEYGLQSLRFFAHSSNSIISEIKHFGGIEVCKMCRAEYKVSRPRIRKHAKYLMEMLDSIKDESLYLLEIEAQRLRRIAGQPNATVNDKIAAAKAQAAVQLAKATK